MNADTDKMTMDIIFGKAWVFGDDIDTDQITPGKALMMPIKDQKQYVLTALKPNFPVEVKRGDVIIAGRNFGCGSSREHSPEVLKELGVGAIVAVSFGRIFFRNAIAIGLPVLIAPKVASLASDGDEIIVDIDNARIKNSTKGSEIKATPLDPILYDILHAGSIIQKLREELKH